jgi:hypothetical protein
MTSNGVASSYRCAHRVRGTGWLGHDVQRTTVLGQCERARVGAKRSEAAIGRSWHGGDTEGILSVRRWRGGELDRGASSGHTARMGVPAHGAYAVRG